MKNIDRRSFVKGALFSGAAAVGASVVGCSPQDPSSTSGDNNTADASGSSNSITARSWEIKPEQIPESEIVETIDVDIAIVGAGIAGTTAAQSAAEDGGKVIVFEKTERANGRGLDVGSIGNRFQKEHPEISQYIDAADAERIYYEFSHSAVNRLLFRFWAQNSGEAFDHLADYMKEKYDLDVYQSATALPDRWGASEYYREQPTCQTFYEGWFDENGEWVFAGFVPKIAQWAQDLGADFRFNTEAVQLVVSDDGDVTGVIAKGEDGYIQANASKGVIISTGDIGGNDEMLAAWCPIALKASANVYTPPKANSGDGIKLALWAGAAMQRGAAAPMIHPLGPGGPLAQSGDSLGFLCVNRNGERFTCELNNTPGLANARLTQPGGIGYTIFDSNYHDNVLKMRPTNIGVEGVPLVDDSTQRKIDEAIAKDDGMCFKADTIADLAKQLGADPSTLEATVKRWNELVDTGEDSDMGLPSDLLTPLNSPPYYASFIPQGILVVIYGLNCDSYSRVCDDDDNPIQGLYAIGNAQGNFFAMDYPLIVAGLSHGRCMTFGYKLPKAMLNDELIALS